MMSNDFPSTSHFSPPKKLQAAASHHQELGLAGRSGAPRRLPGAGRPAPRQSSGRSSSREHGGIYYIVVRVIYSIVIDGDCGD